VTGAARLRLTLTQRNVINQVDVFTGEREWLPDHVILVVNTPLGLHDTTVGMTGDTLQNVGNLMNVGKQVTDQYLRPVLDDPVAEHTDLRKPIGRCVG
jgi:hypothetical protein